MTDEEIYATVKPKRKPSARDRQKGISPSVTSLFGSFSEGEKFRKEAEASKNEASEAKKEANEVKEKNEALSNTVRGLEKKSRLMERALEAFMNLAGYNMSDLNMDAVCHRLYLQFNAKQINTCALLTITNINSGPMKRMRKS